MQPQLSSIRGENVGKINALGIYSQVDLGPVQPDKETK
jgi:hypothetical protein